MKELPREEFAPVRKQKGPEIDWRDRALENRRSKFKIEAVEINHRYGANLPPPAVDLKVITVVPAFRELDNNNFWNLLNSANGLQGGKDRFEIFYVVNNTTEAERTRPDAFEENQRTLIILELIRDLHDQLKTTSSWNKIYETHQNKIVALRLTDYEDRIFRRAIEKGTPFYGIDASGEEKAIDPSLNPRGQARNIGGHLAFQRFKKIGAKTTGIIDFIDADCALSGKYYTNLIEQTGDAQIGYKSLYAITPDISEYVEKEQDPLRQLVGLIQYLKIALLEGRMHYLVRIDKQGRELERTGHGPAISVRASVFEATGGYPVTQGSEDFYFQELVDHIVPRESQRKTAVRLNLSHRSREDASDGLEVGLLKLPPDVQPLEYLNELCSPNMNEKNAGEIKKEIRMYVLSLLRTNQHYEQDPLYRTIRAREFRIERALRSRFLQAAKEVIIAISKKLENEKNEPSDVSEYVRMVKDLPLSRQDFLLANPSILESLITITLLIEEHTSRLEVSSEGTLQEKIMSFFERYLPEFFAPPPTNEPTYNDVLDALLTEPSKMNLSARDFIHLARTIHLYRRKK